MAQANQIEAMTQTRNEKTGADGYAYYFADDELSNRGKALGGLLADGRYSIEELLMIRELLNDLLADGKSMDPNWIKKPQRAETATDEDYRLVLASRLAPGLASLKWLDYQHVTDEDDLGMLQISLAQAGYPLLSTVDECYEFFEKKALGPVRDQDDMPSRAGALRQVRKASEPMCVLPEDCMREGPYKSVKANLRAEQLAALKTQFGLLSASDREAIGVVALEQDDEPRPQEAQVAGSGVAQALAPLVSQIGQMLEGMQELTQGGQKRLKVEVKKADDDEEEDEGKLTVDQRLLRELNLGCVASNSTAKRSSISDMQMNPAVRRINDNQRIRRKVEDSEYNRRFNESLAEETVWLTRLEKIDHLKDRASDLDVIAKCKVKEEHIQEMLEGEKQKQEMLEICIEDHQLGNCREAAECHRLYKKALAHDFRSPFCKKIKEQARTNVKQDRDAAILEHIVRGQASGANGGFSGRRQEAREWRAPDEDQWLEKQSRRQVEKREREGGKGKGGRNTTENFKMRPYVDGTVYDASLAGIKAPDPADFGGYYKARMDAPGIDGEMGKIHRAGWLGTCGFCSKVGHSLTECPASKVAADGKEYVNFRWLYSKRFCQANGRPN